MKKIILAGLLAVTALGAAGAASAQPRGHYRWHGHWYHHRHAYWGPGHRRAWRYW